MILTKILSAVVAVSALSMTVAQQFDNCTLESYYQPLMDAKGAPENWVWDDIVDLVTSTQRNSLPSTSAMSGGDDIFAALADLDRGTDPDNVVLLYRNEEIPAIPAGTPQSWAAERLFPIMRGASRESTAANDVFNLRAADTSVLLSRRGLLFYGECGTVNDQEACVSPATGETADDSAQDGKIITPPAVFRGDVARSLFYMQARYEMELGLFLSDCPPFDEGEFGYLSPLLEWATADVVTDAEVARNELACSRWQGNRNPFVDFPQLIEQFFGLPDTIREGTKSYRACTDETESPTATPNPCSSILPGDVMIFMENSDEPDQVVFFPLADIPDSVGSLFMTDNSWLGGELSTNEGTVEVRLLFLGVCWFCVLLFFSHTHTSCSSYCLSSLTFLKMASRPEVSLRSVMAPSQTNGKKQKVYLIFLSMGTLFSCTALTPTTCPISLQAFRLRVTGWKKKILSLPPQAGRRLRLKRVFCLKTCSNWEALPCRMRTTISTVVFCRETRLISWLLS